MLDKAPDMMRSARAACTCYIFIALSLIIGLIIVVYNICGFWELIPNCSLALCGICIGFLVISKVCSLKPSLLSYVTPTYLAELESVRVVFPTFIGLKLHFFFQVNIITFVLSALMNIPLIWKLRSYVLRSYVLVFNSNVTG